jgi:YVTN family beta-propeller protein
VANAAGSAICVIDTTTKCVKTIYLGYNISGVAVSSNGETLYLVGSGNLIIFDTNKHMPDRSDYKPIAPQQEMLLDVAVTPNGNKIYVTGTQLGKVYVIETENFSYKTIEGFAVPHSIAITPNGQKVYVTNNDNSTVSVIDANTDKIIKTISLS